jgi:RNA polymerase sigma-70 factor (ECF subfamily)
MTDAALDLSSCVERARAGDPASAHALVENLYPLVMKIVRAHRPRRLAEEDLAQEIFVKLFARIHQYEWREGAPFQHWVSRLAVTTCLDALRAEKRRPEWRWADLDEGERQWVEFLHSTQAAGPPSESAGAREIVGKLLEMLSAEDRLVITLLDLEERSVAEISRMTGWGASLVKVRAFRARRKLRRHAEELLQEKTI